MSLGFCVLFFTPPVSHKSFGFEGRLEVSTCLRLTTSLLVLLKSYQEIVKGPRARVFGPILGGYMIFFYTLNSLLLCERSTLSHVLNCIALSSVAVNRPMTSLFSILLTMRSVQVLPDLLEKNSQILFENSHFFPFSNKKLSPKIPHLYKQKF